MAPLPVRSPGLLHLQQLGAVGCLARPDFVLFGAAAGAEELGAPVDELRADLAWVGAPAPVGA